MPKESERVTTMGHFTGVGWVTYLGYRLRDLKLDIRSLEKEAV